MAQLFNKLTEEFDGVSGTLVNYVSLAGVPLTTRRHYDIRSFIGDDISVPRTMLDLRYNNVFGLDGSQMILLDTPRIVGGRTIAARPIGNFDGVLINTMNTFKMLDLDVYTLATGGENWPVDAAVTVGKDSAERWANSIKINLTSGVTKTVTSMFTDNIFPGMESTSSTYYIELVLPGFPAQAAGTHLDLANSYIDFTSDTSGSFAAGQTNSFKFSDSLHTLTAGGDTYWQINRDSLTNIDLHNLAGVRFRLLANGTMTFKAQALRIYKSDEYTFDSVDIETKRGQLKRSVPRDSGTEPSNPTTSTYMMNDTRPKNITLVAKINSGHIDTANDSSFSLIIRNSDGNNYITGNVLVNNSRTQLNLKQTVAGSTTTLNTTNLGVLSGEAFYLLKLEAYENQVRLSLYNTYGAFYGTLVGTTAYQTTTLTQRGRVGFEYKPYNYDFLIDYITASDAEFARFESKVFTSITPVIGATIAAESSPAIDLTEGHFIPAGDAEISIDPQSGTPAPSIKFVRDGSSWQGGYMTDNFIFIGNPQYLKIEGDVFPVLGSGQSNVRGTFRIIFIDKWDSIGYISYIRNLLPSQWNHFDIPLNSTNLAPGNYRILIQQTGFYDDTFYLDNLAVKHLSFSWEASPNAGTTWYKFLTAIDGPYSATNFKEDPGTQLKIRVTALSDDVWISDYELIPIYGIPGQILHTPLGSQSNTVYDVRVTGQGAPTLRTQNVRISSTNSSTVTYNARLLGQASSTSQFNVRIGGVTFSNRVTDVRIIGTLSSNTAYNVRVSGTNGSSFSHDARIVGQSDGEFRGLLALSGGGSGSVSTSLSINTRITGNSGTLLSWAPPTLVSPTTINIPTSGTTDLNLTAGQDYIIHMPSTPVTPGSDGGIYIDGGRNIVLIGGEFDYTGVVNTDPVNEKEGRIFTIYNVTGTVHIEGIYAHGSGLIEGIQWYSPGATLQLQNCRFDHLHVEAAEYHSDLIAFDVSGTLRVDRFTASSELQGISQFFATSNLDLRNVNITGLTGSSDTGPVLSWFTDSVTLTNYYVTPRPGQTLASTLRPNGGTVAGDGSISWPSYPTIVGSVRPGSPPGGDYVPLGVAGLGYVSPGYLP